MFAMRTEAKPRTRQSLQSSGTDEASLLSAPLWFPWVLKSTWTHQWLQAMRLMALFQIWGFATHYRMILFTATIEITLTQPIDATESLFDELARGRASQMYVCNIDFTNSCWPNWFWMKNKILTFYNNAAWLEPSEFLHKHELLTRIFWGNIVSFVSYFNIPSVFLSSMKR